PGVDAAGIDAVAVRVRARDVEGLHAADRAEEVLCGTGIERVAGQPVFSLEQSEPRLRHDEVQVRRATADGTVAIVHLGPLVRFNLEAHRPAVASACINLPQLLLPRAPGPAFTHAPRSQATGSMIAA